MYTHKAIRSIALVVTTLSLFLTNNGFQQISAQTGPSCAVSSFDGTPPPTTLPQGQTVHLTATGSCTNGGITGRFTDNGTSIYELSIASISSDWNTAPVPTGQHTLCVQFKDSSDLQWQFPATKCLPPYTITPGNPTSGGGTGGGSTPCSIGAEPISDTWRLLPYVPRFLYKWTLETKYSLSFLCSGSLVNVVFDNNLNATLKTDAGDIEVEFPSGTPTSASFTIIPDKWSLTTGSSNGNPQSQPGLETGQFFGIQRTFKTSIDPTDIESSIELRQVFIPTPPDLSPATKAVVVTVVIYKMVEAAGPYVQNAPQFIESNVNGLLDLIGGVVENLPNPSENQVLLVNYILPSTDRPLTTTSIDAATTQALAQTYGPLTNSSTLGVLTAHPNHLNPPNSLNFSGTGFTPGGQVFVAFGLPGSPTASIQILTADKKGTVRGKYTAPQTAGTYLLSAVDVQKINTTLTTMRTLGTLSNPATYIAGVLIDVQGSTTTTSNCSLPPQQQPIAACIAKRFGVPYADVAALHFCHQPAYGFGEIERAYMVQQLKGIPASTVLSQLPQSGGGEAWPQLLSNYGLSMKDVSSPAACSPDNKMQSEKPTSAPGGNGNGQGNGGGNGQGNGNGGGKGK